MILYKLCNMIIGKRRVEIGKTRNIFKKKLGLCWDNYLSGANIFNHTSKKVYIMFSTVSHNHLPTGVPEQYMQKREQSLGIYLSSVQDSMSQSSWRRRKQFRDQQYI